MSNDVTETPGRTVTAKRNAGVTKKRKPKPSAFKKLRLRVFLSVEACADLCGVSVRSVQRWDIQGVPVIVHRLLELYDRQDLSGHGPDWRGFRFSRGKLVAGRLSFTPRNLRQVPHYVEIFNMLYVAKMRYNLDGIPLEQAVGMVFNCPSFSQLPLLPNQPPPTA